MNKFCSTSSANRGNSLPSSPPTLCRGEGGIPSDFWVIFRAFSSIFGEERKQRRQAIHHVTHLLVLVAPSSGAEPSSGKTASSSSAAVSSISLLGLYLSLPPLKPPLILTSKGMFSLGTTVNTGYTNRVTDGLSIRHSLRHPSLPQDSRVVGVSHALLSRGETAVDV